MSRTTVRAEVSLADSDGTTRDEFGCALGPDSVLLRGIIRRAIDAFEDLGYADQGMKFEDFFEDFFDANVAAVLAEVAA